MLVSIMSMVFISLAVNISRFKTSAIFPEIMSIVLPNYNIVKYFTAKYSLSHKAGTTLEQQLFERSQYSEVRLGDLLSRCFGGIANNPSISIVFLAMDYKPRSAADIKERANSLLGIQEDDNLKSIYGELVTGYIKGSLLKSTDFALSQESEFGTRYSKSWDGFLIGDVSAYLGIEVSLLKGAKSAYKIWGKALHPSEFNTHCNKLLMLYWLLDNLHKGRDKVRKRDFIREVGECNRTVQAGGKSDHEYIVLSEVARLNCHALSNAGIIDYDSKMREEKRDMEHYSGISFLPAGEELIEIIDPVMRMIGWYDALQKVDGKFCYRMLDAVVKPDLDGLWKYRQEKLVVPDTSQEHKKLIIHARKSRRKHLEDTRRSEKCHSKLNLVSQ